MSLVNWVVNGFNAAVGRKQNFEQLLKAKDIGRAILQMTDNSGKAEKALKVYDTMQHEVMSRPDKAIFGKKDEVTGKRSFLRFDKRWKIPVPYPVYINEIALVFLFGRPLKWKQVSEGTDRAFSAFLEVLKSTRFNAKIREAKRLAGAETVSAMLFHTFRNDEGKADVLIKVLAKSLGDDIYYRKDQFGRLIDFARGYCLQEVGGEIQYYVDIYTKKILYHCKRSTMGWDVEEEVNITGKLPLILFEQEPECAGVEPMINQKEWTISRTADVNDRFSDPALVADASIINSLPEQGETSKLFILKANGDGSKRPEIKYLTWDNAPDSKKLESDELDEKILRFSFTTKIDFDATKGLSQISAKALKQLMLLADIKASKHKERYDEYADRIASLVTTIIGNVLDISLKGECSRLVIEHEFQEPSGEDVEAAINNLVKMYNAGRMSLETLIEKNPLIEDSEAEKARIAKEHEADLQEEKERNRLDVFNSAE